MTARLRQLEAKLTSRPFIGASRFPIPCVCIIGAVARSNAERLICGLLELQHLSIHIVSPIWNRSSIARSRRSAMEPIYVNYRRRSGIRRTLSGLEVARHRGSRSLLCGKERDRIISCRVGKTLPSNDRRPKSFFGNPWSLY